ncbi:MAG: MerR family transcriptional regulator [Hyphomicrobiales bacterium]|nr:MerR family transcriptional regulator [Hyphomicrobiales bacterium]
MEKSPDAFRTISEVADDLDLPQHVLRFWETRFSQIKPMKRTGGRRYYRPADIELVRAIKGLLYGQGYTIKGVQKLFKENGVRAVVAAAQGGLPLGPTQTALALDADAAEAPGVVSAEPSDNLDDPTGVPQQQFPGATAAALAALADELAECARILRAVEMG